MDEIALDIEALKSDAQEHLSRGGAFTIIVHPNLIEEFESYLDDMKPRYDIMKKLSPRIRNKPAPFEFTPSEEYRLSMWK